MDITAKGEGKLNIEEIVSTVISAIKKYRVFTTVLQEHPF